MGAFVCLSCCFGCGYDIPWESSEESPGPSQPDETPTPTSTPVGSTTVFAADFEDGDGAFTVVGNNNSSWEWGEPSSGPNAATSGFSVWATNLSGRYQDNDDSCLVSPPVELPIAALELHYQLAVETEEGFDYWRVEIGDGGGVGEMLDGGSGGSSSDYSLEMFDISQFAGATVRIQFCLTTDEGVRDDGLYVDDVAVYSF